ncbi:ABC transporter permease [Segniliparus rugosus]|uniref:TIGR00245 family protein n=1 Tax=Segniliparus rugosus (strain ATCC BAA-974 / DSM 45345 / CCUG 50838 / CIP 108380 / JCM 13579 / CDC 945) TaxID=679197 RepID=E5XQT2_SEGRC|nr:ABC transporter permease [Segniliparus rugosus]EFV13305.2 TIGR00245 family protein [Segniliparus rugosus ATCC BAA-974]
MTSPSLVTTGPEIVVVLVVLAALAVLFSSLGGLGHGGEILVAAARAAAQLGVLAAVLACLAVRPKLTPLLLLVMAGAAAWTAARRVVPKAGPRVVALCALPVAAPTLLLVGALVIAGVVPARPLAVVPVVGILLGNAMSATSLSGRRARDELRTRAGEVEAALALGFSPREARLEICRPAVASTLLPGIDSAKATGLVTLPGAFVGTLLAGAGAVQSGVVQLFVILGILAVQTAATAILLQLVAGEKLRLRLSVTHSQSSDRRSME